MYPFIIPKLLRINSFAPVLAKPNMEHSYSTVEANSPIIETVKDY